MRLLVNQPLPCHIASNLFYYSISSSFHRWFGICVEALVLVEGVSSEEAMSDRDSEGSSVEVQWEEDASTEAFDDLDDLRTDGGSNSVRLPPGVTAEQRLAELQKKINERMWGIQVVSCTATLALHVALNVYCILFRGLRLVLHWPSLLAV